jgi:hypothetical protein
VALPEEAFSSVAMVRPLGKVVMRVPADCLAAVAKGRTNYLKNMNKKKTHKDQII